MHCKWEYIIDLMQWFDFGSLFRLCFYFSVGFSSVSYLFDAHLVGLSVYSVNSLPSYFFSFSVSSLRLEKKSNRFDSD